MTRPAPAGLRAKTGPPGTTMQDIMAPRVPRCPHGEPVEGCPDRYPDDVPTHDPLAGIDPGPCDDYAPDTLAPDPEDRDVCTTCYYRGPDHRA